MSNVFPLSEGKLNVKYKISEVRGEARLKRRLLDLGFVNTQVEIVRTSSLKGVYLVSLRGFLMALRREQAECVLVTNNDGENEILREKKQEVRLRMTGMIGGGHGNCVSG